jgi:hypothetical protein
MQPFALARDGFVTNDFLVRPIEWESDSTLRVIVRQLTASSVGGARRSTTLAGVFRSFSMTRRQLKQNACRPQQEHHAWAASGG